MGMCVILSNVIGFELQQRVAIELKENWYFWYFNLSNAIVIWSQVWVKFQPLLVTVVNCSYLIQNTE